jgi:hypothetical protein
MAEPAAALQKNTVVQLRTERVRRKGSLTSAELMREAMVLGCLGAQIAAQFGGGAALNEYLTNAETCGKQILRDRKAP